MRCGSRCSATACAPISAGSCSRAAPLARPDALTEIKTTCPTGPKATLTVRVDDAGRAVQAGPQVEIGGNERYVSVSRAEFKKVMRGEGSIDPLQQPLPLARR